MCITPHFSLAAAPVSLNIFPWDNPPELWKYQSWGWIRFVDGYFFRAQGQEKNPACTNPVPALNHPVVVVVSGQPDPRLNGMRWTTNSQHGILSPIFPDLPNLKQIQQFLVLLCCCARDASSTSWGKHNPSNVALKEHRIYDFSNPAWAAVKLHCLSLVQD